MNHNLLVGQSGGPTAVINGRNNYPHYVVFRVKYSFFYVHFTQISLQISRKLMN